MVPYAVAAKLDVAAEMEEHDLEQQIWNRIRSGDMELLSTTFESEGEWGKSQLSPKGSFAAEFQIKARVHHYYRL